MIVCANGRVDLIAIGWCIESRTDEEMPETICGAVNINRPATSWPDVNPKLFGKFDF
jgi:hypothetical protein